MKTFKTKKGTELPLLDLRGKDYLVVAYRLVWMREDHPDWSIETEITTAGPEWVVVKATIRDGAKTLATAHKREDAKGFQDYLEKAETGAVGRALAMCGYGTQFAPDLEEGERIVDAPLERVATRSISPAVKPVPIKIGLKTREELNNHKIDFGKYNGKRFVDLGPDALRNYASWMTTDADRSGKPLSDKAHAFLSLVDQFVTMMDPFKEEPFDFEKAPS